MAQTLQNCSSCFITLTVLVTEKGGKLVRRKFCFQQVVFTSVISDNFRCKGVEPKEIQVQFRFTAEHFAPVQFWSEEIRCYNFSMQNIKWFTNQFSTLNYDTFNSTTDLNVLNCTHSRIHIQKKLKHGVLTLARNKKFQTILRLDNSKAAGQCQCAITFLKFCHIEIYFVITEFNAVHNYIHASLSANKLFSSNGSVHLQIKNRLTFSNKHL